jgi:hypothetical protein
LKEHDEVQICEPAPFIYYENGQLAVTDGASVWLVIVTCEALRATANPPERSLRRLLEYSDFYRDVAAAAIHRGDDVDGKIWITEAMVRSTASRHKRPRNTVHISPRGLHSTHVVDPLSPRNDHRHM